MKNDPYSTLGGLDQLLFKDNATTATTPPAKAPKSTRAHGDAGTHSHEHRSVPAGESPKAPKIEGSQEPPAAVTTVPARAGQVASAPDSTLEAMRTRASAPTGLRVHARIPGVRHSHDLFQDQVRWINRVKLDLEETYGKRVSGNDIVQLALDIFIKDYETNGDDSALIATLVLGQPGTERGGP